MTTAHASEPLTRREREKMAHRREILEAAERVFAEKGFDRATVEAVAHAAEFSVGAIYTFFENKEVLWLEVITKIGQDFLDTFRKEAGAANGPLEAIHAVIQLRLRHMQEHGAFLRVFLEYAPGGKASPVAAIPRSCHGIYDAYIDEAAALFKAAMAKGLLRKADATYTALSFEGVINSFRAYWARRGIALSLAEQAGLVQRYFLTPIEIRKGEK
jgi:AcrR family transcriptional regulator